MGNTGEWKALAAPLEAHALSRSDETESQRPHWDAFVAEDSAITVLANTIAERVAEKLALVVRPRPKPAPRKEKAIGPSVYPDPLECLHDTNVTLERMVREWDEITVQGLCNKMPKQISPRTLKERLQRAGVFERDMRWTVRKLAEPFRKKHGMLLALGATLALSSDALITGCIKGL